MVLKSCVKPAARLSNILFYQSWYFRFVNTSFILFIVFGVLLFVKSFPIVLSALNDRLNQIFESLRDRIFCGPKFYYVRVKPCPFSALIRTTHDQLYIAKYIVRKIVSNLKCKFLICIL